MKNNESILNISIDEREDENVVELNIEGMIGDASFDDEDSVNTKELMREQLKQIDAIEADKIVVNISSLGGNVDHGLAIFDLLAEHPAEVETKVSGMTASAATVIAQAGKKRVMSDNALYLVHRAWTLSMGNANDFLTLAQNLEKTDGVISNIYAKRGDKNQDFYMGLMSENGGSGIWLNAEEALKYGLVDEVIEPLQKVAMSKQAIEAYGLPAPEGIENEVDLEEDIKERDEELSNESKEEPSEPKAEDEGNAAAGRERELELLKISTRK